MRTSSRFFRLFEKQDPFRRRRLPQSGRRGFGFFLFVLGKGGDRDLHRRRRRAVEHALSAVESHLLSAVVV